MLPRLVVTLVALAAGGAVQASAQLAAGSIRVGPRLGYDMYEDKTGVDAGALIGVDASYFFSRSLGVGAYIDFSRVQTDGKFFPMEQDFISAGGDSTLIFAVEQPLTTIKYGGYLTGSLQMGRLAPFALLGIGAYQIQLDPQAAAGDVTFTELQYTLAGGLDLSLGSNSVVRLEVRDYFLQSFDRERLNPVAPQFQPVRFPEVVPPQEPFNGSTHNLAFTLSFQFIPGGAR